MTIALFYWRGRRLVPVCAAKNIPERTLPISSDSILMQQLQIVQMLAGTTAYLLDHNFYCVPHSANFAIMFRFTSL